MIKKHFHKHFWKYFIIIIILIIVSIGSYNYYYYYKSKSLIVDTYKNLNNILLEFNQTLTDFSLDNDPEELLNSLNTLINNSQRFIHNNNAIMNNIFVKLNRVNGILFPSELGDLLLWYSNFDDKIISLRDNFAYIVQDGIGLAVLNKNNNNKDTIQKIKTDIADINKQLNKVDTILQQSPHNVKLGYDVVDIKVLTKNLRNLNDFIDTLDWLLGNQKTMRHLVIFQNPYNLSATGGEWVLYGILNCKNSLCQFDKIDFISNLNIAMLDKLVPPDELKYSNSVWVFQYFNWFFNFKTSAQTALKYYPQQEKFDGLISVNISLIEKLLENINPIKFNIDKEDISVTSRNVNEFLSTLDNDFKSNKQNQSQQKLDLFFQQLFINIGNTLDIKRFTTLFTNLIFQSLDNKDIQIYSTNSSVEHYLSQCSWAGSFPDSIDKNTDYIGIARANTTDTDIDQNIKEDIKIKITINEKGEITNDVKLILQNNNPKTVRTKSYSYLRVYIPPNSEIVNLVSASQRGPISRSAINYEKQGFKIDNVLESINIKTVYIEDQDAKTFLEENFVGIGSWIITSSQTQKTFSLNYKPNIHIDLQNNPHYNLFLQKQSGINRSYTIEVLYPAQNNPGQYNSITQTLILDKDTLLSFDLN